MSDLIKELLASDRVSEVKCREKLHVINPLLGFCPTIGETAVNPQPESGERMSL